jgi:hypothetical protein
LEKEERHVTMRRGRWILVVVGGLVPSCYASFADLADGSDDAMRDARPDTTPDVPLDVAVDVPPADDGDVPVEDSRTDADYDAPTTCEFFEFGITWGVSDGSYYDAERIYAAGAGPIMHMIAVYESTVSRRIVVHVGRTYRPVILVLGSYESITWEIRPEPGAVIDRILLYGYDPQDIESEIAIPVERDESRLHPGFRWPFASGGGETQAVVWDAEARTGLPLSTFSGAYEVNELWIRHYCREDCAAAVACHGVECGTDTDCLRECGACPDELSCLDNVCVACEPDCSGRACGSDGCGGSCGSCALPLECDSTGVCAAPDYFPSCASVTGESHYCAMLLEGGLGVAGLDSGLLCSVGKSFDYLASGSAAVSSIAFSDGFVHVCGSMMGAGGLLRVDVREGTWSIVPHLDCEAVAAWNDGLLVMGGRGSSGGLTFYSDWEHAMAGDGEPIPAYPSATRMTASGDRLYSAWHSTSEVLVNELPSGAELPSITLEGYDDWIWGMSVTEDGWLMIGNLSTITVFDAATGARLETVHLHATTADMVMLGGLACFTNP